VLGPRNPARAADEVRAQLDALGYGQDEAMPTIEISRRSHGGRRVPVTSYDGPATRSLVLRMVTDTTGRLEPEK
jgi:hypothetical protein